MDATDHELLRQFAAHRSEDAFRRLVNRHVGLVFSVARRVTDDPQLAEEVAQTTFATLAQKAGELRPDDVPAGWLYHTARHLALRAVRSEQRRRQREHLAATMNTDEPGPSVVAEHLESAMDQLPPADRDALVLRYFEDRNLREVGHELGLTEDAARMRVNRALEKLRGVFGKLGITGSAAWLGTTLTSSASASVPAGLGATITTTVLSGTAVAAATTALVTETTATTMNLFNLKTAAAILGAAAVTGTTTYLVQEREADRLRADYQTLNETRAKLAAGQQEARELIKLRDEQIAVLKRNVEDLPRLRGEMDALRRVNLDLEDKARLLAAASNPKALDDDAALREAIEIARQTNERREILLQNRYFIVAASYASLLHQALMTAAEANGGRYPDSMSATLEHVGPTMYHEGLKIDDRSVSAHDFEILYQGNVLDIEDPVNTVLFRERFAFAIGVGKAFRLVYYANGRAEKVGENYLPSGELEVRRPRDPSADYE
jgi:RNA polymerase sigma factor (sigma-70 family)